MLQEAPRAVEPVVGPLRQRVLVVDDNRDSADSLGWLLDSFGAEVRVSYDGAEALEVIRHWHPSLVLLDVGMPGMNGLQVASAVRAEHELDDVCLVALTGAGLDEDRERARVAGFDQHLLKPVDPESLEALLAQLHQCR